MFKQLGEFLHDYGHMGLKVLRRGQAVIVAWAGISALIFALLRGLLGDQPPRGAASLGALLSELIAQPTPQQAVILALCILVLSFARAGLSAPLIVYIFGKHRSPRSPFKALKMGIKAAPRTGLAEILVALAISAVASVALLLDVDFTLFVQLCAATSLALFPFLAARLKLKRAFFIGTKLARRYWTGIFATFIGLILLSMGIDQLTARMEATGPLALARSWSLIMGYEFVSWFAVQTMMLTIVERAIKRRPKLLDELGPED